MLLPSRLLKMLAWAFDVDGNLDPGRLLSILAHEGVVLSPRHVLAVGEFVGGCVRSGLLHPLNLDWRLG